MAADIVGTEMQGWAALLEQHNMLEALEAQLAQQSQYQNQAYTQFSNYAPSLGADAANKTLASASASRDSQYKQSTGLPLTVGPPASNETKAALALQGQQRANLGAYGDYNTQQGIGQSNMQEVLNRISNRAQGSASVFPYTLDAAQHSFDNLSSLGQAIASLGGGSTNFQSIYGSQANYFQRAGGLGQQQPVGGQGQYYDSGQGAGLGGMGGDVSAYTSIG